MPPTHHTPIDILSSLQYLEEQNWISIESIRYSLNQLDGSFLYPDIMEDVLRGLQSCPRASGRVLELTLSYGNWCRSLSEWLLDHFPKTADAFLSSVHALVLDRLSLFLLFLRHPFEREDTLTLSAHRVRIELAPQVMQSMSSLTFNNDSDEIDVVEDEYGLPRARRGKQQPKKRARKAASRQTVTLNPKDFERLDLCIPLSSSDVEAHSSALLVHLKRILQEYLALLQKDSIATSIQNSLIIPQGSTNDDEDLVADKEVLTIDTSMTDGAGLPSAFPMVQPMKAALYFDSAAGFGEWRILISTRADRDLRDARRKDAKFFAIVIKKIKELSNGHFSDDNQKRLNRSDIGIPIFEAKMTRDSRLVYQVDCIPEYDDHLERQVIKVFGIYTHTQIDQRLWDSMGYQLRRKGKEYRKRCIFRNRPHHAGDNVFMPAMFPPSEREEKESLIMPELRKEDLEEIHSLLVLEKFVTLSQELLNSILADLDVAHVFNVTPQEKEIIEHPYSCYVLGRSGTGKTTTMLFKMLGIERAYSLQQVSVPKPRQVFVTQSRVLATRVEEYFSKLLDSLATASKSREELRQIAKQKQLQQDEGNLMIDVDDDITWQASLPQKFSLLQEEHFPLFLTFDRLAKMLEADLVDVQISPTARTSKRISTQAMTSMNQRLINYDIFFQDYWPHFPQSLVKGLDPALVFSEMMGVLLPLLTNVGDSLPRMAGVIEGSEQSLSYESRYLDQYTYENLSDRTQYVFAKQRDVVYSLFVAYLKQKRSQGHYDVADRTHRILKAFENSGVPGQKVDYLYVDEAQDNLLIDAMLLRSICRNPDGLFWAGDTAQTIAIGSSFRFDDLKAFLYRLEERREATLLSENLRRSSGNLRTFQLAINYRSHGGIVQCAHSVIELITGFWPYAIDMMAKEEGVVDGAKPVFFSGWDSDTVRYEQFLFGESGNRIEFGAQQCILVRDEAARAELREQVGDIGLIMTLYESKGLEFDDVLLYKFFEDSTVDLSLWRVVLNLLDKQFLVHAPAPRFDETRHAGVCNELKFLYVAITRARKNLWIVDCSDKGEPMRTFWMSKDQIQNCTPGTDVPRLAVSSSPQEWQKSGRTLFQNKRYLQAMHCYERAGLPREVKVSHTYYLREQARATLATTKHLLAARHAAFSFAAVAFLDCAKLSRTKKERRVYSHNAGDCFENAEALSRAAQAYVDAEEYEFAVKLYRKVGMFDEAVEIVADHRREMTEEVAENLIEVAKLYYFNQNQLGKATRLFESAEEQLQYLEDYDLDDCRAALLAELGRRNEAADIHLAEGRTLEAIRVLLGDDNDEASVRKGHQCIVQGLWKNASFARKIKEDNVDASELLEFANKVNTSFLTESSRDELAMFQAIRLSDRSQLRSLGRRFYARKEFPSALLCFDHYFMAFPAIMNMLNTQICEVLDDFYGFCRLLHETAVALDPGKPGIQKLFGFHPSSTENMYTLPDNTWVHLNLIKLARGPILVFDEKSILISGQELSPVLKKMLFERITKLIKEENNICQRTYAFTPCLPFIINDMCGRIHCPRQHISYKALTHSWFNTQLRIHLQQILIFQILHSTPFDIEDRFKEHRYWINRLFETLNPPAYYLGSQASLDLSLIPEGQRGIQVAKNWCRDLLNWKPRLRQPTALSLLYQTASLCIFFDRQEAERYIYGSLLNYMANDGVSFRRKSNQSLVCILPELLSSLQASNKDFITAGILFLKQVVDDMLFIDINVLCDLLEFLCGSVILVRVRFNLHNVALPRSWFISLLRRIKKGIPQTDTRLIDALLYSMKAILERLITGNHAVHLLFENRDLKDLPAIREIYIPRICRAMGLLGYNIHNNDLRSQILKFLIPLQKAKPHYLSTNFARARTWNSVAHAIQNSTTESPLDEMVQLRLADVAWNPPAGIKRLVFKPEDDIPRLVSGAFTPAFLSSLRADAPSFVPRPRQVQNIANNDANGTQLGNGTSDLDTEIEDTETNEQNIEEPEADTTNLVDSKDIVDSIANTATPVVNKEISQEQIDAARVLLAAYRVLVAGRSPKKKTALESTRMNFFEACLAQSKEILWPHGSCYKMLYLGPVPHLLVCLSAVLNYAHSAKSKAKKRWKEVEHQELEDIGKRMTEFVSLLKNAQKIQKALEPLAEVHKRRDLDELKRLVGEVQGLVNQIPPGQAQGVQADLELATKGIVQQKAPPKPKPKPTLNMDDVDVEEIGDYDECYPDI